MTRRTLLALVALLVLAAPADAAPGGAMSGRIAVDWASAGWNGHAEVALEPGETAKQAALAAVHAAQPHYLRPTGFFMQGAHIVSVQGTRSTSFDCGEGMQTTATTVLGLRDTRLPFTTDVPELDLRRGTGRGGVSPWEDNPGYPGLPTHLAYFLPVPGRVAVRRTDSGCGESFAPSSEDQEVNAFDWRGEAAVPVGFVRWLDAWDVPLRRRGSAWGATGKVRTTDEALTFDVSYDLRLVGPPRAWSALCRVPGNAQLGRTVGSALGVLRRAGFPRARFAGTRRTAGHPSGRLFVDDHFTSSGEAPCATGRPKVYRAVPFRR